MNDLRKAAEMALEALEVLDKRGGLGLDVHEYIRTKIEALRQALAHQALDRMVAKNQRLGLYDDKPAVKSYCGGKPNYCTPEQGNNSPNYPISESSTPFVDGVNMTQDRVDETAKGGHEPVAWAYPEFFDGLKNNGCWTVYAKEGKGPHSDGIERTPLYTAPPSVEAAVLAEREACAKLLEDAAFTGTIISCTSAAKAIRARGEKPPVKSYCGGKPNYCTSDVDAVNMTQDRVDETAKGEHEPVAWCIVESGRVHGLVKSKPAVMNAEKWQPLYTAPPISDYHEGWEEGFKAAKREWVGLTDAEIDKVAGDVGYGYIDVAKAIEAKLKEKNNG